MIYLSDTSEFIVIPKHVNSEGNYTLKVTSNMSNEVILVENGSNISTTDLFYKFSISNLNLLNVGEYTYTLYDKDNNISETGLLTYGDYKREVVAYNTFNNEKKQYNG